MNRLTRNIPNLITLIRIIGAVILIFLEPLSVSFLIVYAVCGASDALDGFAARKLHVTSVLGSLLDSLSDLVFYTVMAIKIFPVLVDLLEIYHWLILAVPFVFHMLGYLICAIKFKKFSAIHTYANKAMSFGIFFYPFFLIGGIYWLYTSYMIVGGLVALYSSIEICLIHLLSDSYDTSNKTIFHLLRKKKSV